MKSKVSACGLGTAIDYTNHSSNSHSFRAKLVSRAERAENRQGGLWYVRNVAKANRKAHTPVSNEINASSFSGARAKSEREQLNQHMRLTVRHVLLVENSRTESEMSLG